MPECWYDGLCQRQVERPSGVVAPTRAALEGSNLLLSHLRPNRTPSTHPYVRTVPNANRC